MKHILIIAFGLCLLCQSCEDPIDVTLDEAERLLVVDAWLDDIPGKDQIIRLSYSQPYFDSTQVSEINEANIKITTDSGVEYIFENINDGGDYRIEPNFTWIHEEVGTTFFLSIDLGAVSYTAAAYKNRVPEIDSIQQDFRESDAFADDGIYCNFFATDLEGLGDTYWIKTYKNGAYLNRPSEINLAFDAGFSSGSEVDNLVFIQPIQELNNPVDDNFAPIPWVTGDEIRVEIHSITNEAFFYMEVLRDQLLNSSNSIFAEPQANTSGNITSTDEKEVLGFFNVASTSFLVDTIR